MNQTMNVCFSQASDGGLDEEKNRKNIQDHQESLQLLLLCFPDAEQVRAGRSRMGKI